MILSSDVTLNAETNILTAIPKLQANHANGQSFYVCCADLNAKHHNI